MKICIIGGSSLYRLPIYNQMAKEINCDYYISEDDPQMGIVKYDVTQLSNYKGQLGQEKKVVGNFTWIGGMIGLFFKPYDIYIIGGPYCLCSWIMILLSFFSKKKIATWSHGLYGREKGLRKIIKILYYKLCDINFVYNKRAVALMEKANIKSQNICVYNSLDTDLELSIRNDLNVDNQYRNIFKNDYPVVIFVGRVIEDKRLHQVIDSMVYLREKGIRFNFFVVGKDIDGVNLKKIAADKGVSDNIYMYGPCYDNKITAQFFYNAAVCVSPGAVGLTATNAMTYGCPVISHDDFSHQGPEFEAIVPGVTGDFFKSNNIKDLSDKLYKWITIDSKERAEIRKNCFNEVDNNWNIYKETEAFKNALL